MGIEEAVKVCFSATANFVGSGVLGAVGVATLTNVKHKRELLFAALPTLFAIHQFIEGFVWLGLDGILSPVVTHNMGAAFVLYAQGLLPFLLPLSVLLFEPDVKSRRRMTPFLAIAQERRGHCEIRVHLITQRLALVFNGVIVILYPLLGFAGTDK